MCCCSDSSNSRYNYRGVRSSPLQSSYFPSHVEFIKEIDSQNDGGTPRLSAGMYLPHELHSKRLPSIRGLD